MRLIVLENPEYDDNFIEWLLERVKGEIVKSINVKKLRSFDIIQNNLNIFTPRYKSKSLNVDFVKTVFTGVKLLTYKKVKNAWIIYMKEDVVHPYYFATIYSLCKFVNYGRNDIKGYPIFTKAFNRVSAQITKYYKMYLRELLLI